MNKAMQVKDIPNGARIFCPYCGAEGSKRVSVKGNAYFALRPGQKHSNDTCRAMQNTRQAHSLDLTSIESLYEMLKRFGSDNNHTSGGSAHCGDEVIGFHTLKQIDDAKLYHLGSHYRWGNRELGDVITYVRWAKDYFAQLNHDPGVHIFEVALNIFEKHDDQGVMFSIYWRGNSGWVRKHVKMICIGNVYEKISSTLQNANSKTRFLIIGKFYCSKTPECQTKCRLGSRACNQCHGREMLIGNLYTPKQIYLIPN